jgi:hypothetical protein
MPLLISLCLFGRQLQNYIQQYNFNFTTHDIEPYIEVHICKQKRILNPHMTQDALPHNIA